MNHSTPLAPTLVIPISSPSLPSSSSSSSTFFFFTHSSDPKSKSIKCRPFIHSYASCKSPSPPPPPVVRTLAAAAEKVKRVVLEFKSLPEPIDRVKRLLRYAESLPPCSECSAREPESRVPGCTTQVWLEAELDKLGRMRFRADSDSEISKGFCSCLIWMLDGAEPREVLEIRPKDLEDVNVGLYGKANSRVNTWHNVLLAMQRKTQALITAAAAAAAAAER